MSQSTSPSSPPAHPVDALRAAGLAQIALDAGASSRPIDAMSFIMDVLVELGRRNVRIGEVLRLGPGSVLEVSKANGEPLDIYVNNRLIARGEAVVVGERYGVRLTEVLVTDPAGRAGAES